MDFNSFCQIELYLDKRILDWRFYILGWALGIGHGPWGIGFSGRGVLQEPLMRDASIGASGAEENN